MGKKPTERAAKRAAEIWGKLLQKPRLQAKEPVINTQDSKETLDSFVEILAKRILTPEPFSESYRGTYLSSDYGPEEVLADVAKEAGVKGLFPWKTYVIIIEDYLAVDIHEERVYHYPLKDDRWLVTTLRGEEIEKIKAFIDEGTPLVFTIE